MKNYLKVDIANARLVMDRTFAKNCAIAGSAEYNLLQSARKDYPNFTVEQRTIKRNANKECYRGLTYEYMKKYIASHEPEETVDAVQVELKEMILISKCHSMGYRYPTIKAWFLDTLYYAMSSDKSKQKVPQKVSFSYLTHDIGNVDKPVERKTKYVVSPYKLLINDGNYYLLAYVNEKQGIKTFRVDRIKNVVLMDEPREGEKVFAALNLKTFTQSHFGMFSGEKVNVSLRCIPPLLDTMIDRFGTKGVVYSRADDRHFRVSVDIEISDQFFSWIAGFGTKVVIETPAIAEKYMAFLDKIKTKY